ncbi:hypothetical protein ALC56_03017 [Trachymyrmex septentrionalis]|uniref:Uncharacterized protein n=1 Tax=Trachymyrmex septentrionalis TaxID=34720 RepID=A0A151K069_9HYME|nr:hypothetical protein ALC56_03017 [Trachymyrmex septentrionalis]
MDSYLQHESSIKVFQLYLFLKIFFSINIVYSFVLLYCSASFHTILTRLLAWIPTVYKFLKIGIVVGSTPHIKIAIDDTRGNRIILPHATWMAFIEKRVSSDDNMKLTVSESAYMKPSTILFMLELEHCVKHIYFDLCQYTNIISDKFKYFVTHLRQNCI